MENFEEKLEELHDDVRAAHRKDGSIVTWLWRGILFGIGSTVGVALIFYVFIIVAQQLAGVPILGSILGSLKPLIEQTVETRVPNASKFLPNTPLTIVDPASLYTLEVPKGWSVTALEGADGIQRSKVEAESPDFRSRIDENSNTVYYEAGAKLSIEVAERMEEPTYANLIEQRVVTISSQPANFSLYQRGNTAAGRLVDITFTYQNNSYLLTFVYNPETYPNADAVLDDILTSFTLTQ